MSDTGVPTEAEQVDPTEPSEATEERYSCLDSWLIRGTLGVFLLLGIVAIIGGFAYTDARNNRNQPIKINHDPRLQLVSEEYPSDTQRIQRYEGAFTGIDMAMINDLEAFYLEQMDKCFRLSEQVDPTPEQFHEIVCQKDRSHELLGFTQFTSVRIRPVRDENRVLTGTIIVLVDDRWEG